MIQTPKLTWPVAMPDTLMVVATTQDLRNPDFATWLRAQTGQDPAGVNWQAVQAPVLHRPQLAPYVLHWAALPRTAGGEP